MDLQPSGNKNEIYVDTPKLGVTIKCSKDKINFIKNNTLNSFRFNCEDKVNDVSDDIEKFVFYEYTNYQFVIEGDSNDLIEFFHENSIIREAITPTGRRTNNTLSGIINFRGDIGYTDFIIKVNGKEYLTITGEVYPSKIDYKEDYLAILQDIREEMYNLAYDFLRRTYLNMSTQQRNTKTLTEFYSILSYIFNKLMKSIDIIINQPHHILSKELMVQRAHKVNGSSKETIRWLEKRPNNMMKVGNDYIPQKALNIKKRVTYDTRENRFLKYMIKIIHKKLFLFEKNYDVRSYEEWGRKRKVDELLLKEINKMKRELNIVLKRTFLKDVGNYTYTDSSLSMVFSMGTGYREVYKYFLMLQKGLTLNGEIFRLSMKELSTLYEYWCFIKINALLRKKYEMVSADFIKVNRNGIFLTLKKGIKSQVTYEGDQGRFIISYNSERKTMTTTQKPDNIFTIKREDVGDCDNNKGEAWTSGDGLSNGSEMRNNINEERTSSEVEYIFDAKYKIDMSKSYISKYNTPGPKEEDINTMHRYRDSLRYQISKKKHDDKVDNIGGALGKQCDHDINNIESRLDKQVMGAFILFPYKDEEEYREHQFFNSIEQVGIGGLPFLPGACGCVEDVLEILISL